MWLSGKCGHLPAGKFVLYPPVMKVFSGYLIVLLYYIGQKQFKQ